MYFSQIPYTTGKIKLNRSPKETLNNYKSVNSRKDIPILNVHTSNNRVSKYMKQKPAELKGEIDKSTVVPGDLKTLLSVVNRTSRKKISKNRNWTTPSTNSNWLYTELHPRAADNLSKNILKNRHIFQVHMEHLQDRKYRVSKTNLNKLKWLGIIQSMSSDHNWIKLEINYRTTTRNSLHICKIKIKFLSKPQVTKGD